MLTLSVNLLPLLLTSTAVNMLMFSDGNMEMFPSTRLTEFCPSDEYKHRTNVMAGECIAYMPEQTAETAAQKARNTTKKPSSVAFWTLRPGILFWIILTWTGLLLSPCPADKCYGLGLQLPSGFVIIQRLRALPWLSGKGSEPCLAIALLVFALVCSSRVPLSRFGQVCR
jgi:hypothetical protein